MILVKLLQSSNALERILLPPVIITVFSDTGNELPKIYLKFVFVVPFNILPTNGIVMLVKAVQPENAPAPILVTLDGIMTLVKLLQL